MGYLAATHTLFNVGFNCRYSNYHQLLPSYQKLFSEIEVNSGSIFTDKKSDWFTISGYVTGRTFCRKRIVFAHFHAFLNIFEQTEWQIRFFQSIYVSFRKVTLATGVPL